MLSKKLQNGLLPENHDVFTTKTEWPGWGLNPHRYEPPNSVTDSSTKNASCPAGPATERLGSLYPQILLRGMGEESPHALPGDVYW